MAFYWHFKNCPISMKLRRTYIPHCTIIYCDVIISMNLSLLHNLTMFVSIRNMFITRCVIPLSRMLSTFVVQLHNLSYWYCTECFYNYFSLVLFFNLAFNIFLLQKLSSKIKQVPEFILLNIEKQALLQAIMDQLASYFDYSDPTKIHSVSGLVSAYVCLHTYLFWTINVTATSQ